MSFVIVHNETGLFAARKNFGGDSWGLTDVDGEIQIFSKIGQATRKMNSLKKEYKQFREFLGGDDEIELYGSAIPSDDFIIYHALVEIGEPVG